MIYQRRGLDKDPCSICSLLHHEITDFGLAQLHDERTVTVEGKISGTLRYMAPECLHGWPADCRTDICSLDVVLEEMVGARSS